MDVRHGRSLGSPHDWTSLSSTSKYWSTPIPCYWTFYCQVSLFGDGPLSIVYIVEPHFPLPVALASQSTKTAHTLSEFTSPQDLSDRLRGVLKP